MSRIYEALKRAEQARGITLRNGEEPRAPERRRSPRLPRRVPVFVYGHSEGKRPFHEETHTLQVNVNGGLLILSARVAPGEKLLLTNKLTQREQECEVVCRRAKHTRAAEVGVAFKHPTFDFWKS